MVTNNNNNHISKKREHTAQKIIDALKGTRGLLTLAARKAGVSYSTVNRYALDFASVRQAVEEAKESMTDFAEGKLFEKISKGDTASIIFYLKTKGKSRGYIERHEVGGEGGSPIKVDVDGKGKLISAIARLATRVRETGSDKQPESERS